MSWGDEMNELLSERPAAARADVQNSDLTRLKQEKNELHAALQHLLAKPRCGRCRKAAQLVVDRIKMEV